MSDNLEKLKLNFDVREYLDTRGITIYDQGKNVNRGWIGIQCVFCPDDSNHLGIRLNDNKITCFKCGGHSIENLIKEIDGISFKDTKEIIKSFQKDDFFFNEDEEKNQPIKNKNLPVLPKEFTFIKQGKEPKSVKKYFKKRKFSLSLIQEYKVGYCKTGRYAFHILLPIFINKKIVSFIAVNVITNEKTICPNYRALVNKGDLIYGFDDIINAKKLYIVEGHTDRWRIGKNAIALLTNRCSTSVLMKIKQRVNKECKIIVILDIDAKRNAEQLAHTIKSIFFTNEVIFVEIEKHDNAKDPDQLNKQQIKKIKNL